MVQQPHICAMCVRESIVRLRVVALALVVAAHASAAQATFRRADVDSAGQLRIMLSNDRVIRPSKDSGQVGVEQVALSRDHRTVGWAALYPNCCTSYPIPLELVLLRSTGARTVIRGDLPVWQWGFAADGKSVVIREAPVHGAAPAVYERRDIRTGHVIATVTVDSTARAPATLPEWARVAMPRRAP